MDIFAGLIEDAPEHPPPPRGPMRTVERNSVLALLAVSLVLMIVVLWLWWPYVLALLVGLLSSIALAARRPNLPTELHMAAGAASGLLVGLGLVALGLI